VQGAAVCGLERAGELLMEVGGRTAKHPHHAVIPRQLFANAVIAASRLSAYPCVGVRSSWYPKARDHIHALPTGAALGLKIRPTTAPSARTPKSSSVHSPERRDADARLRIRPVTSATGPRVVLKSAGVIFHWQRKPCHRALAPG
jgi:hypothetical protein